MAGILERLSADASGRSVRKNLHLAFIRFTRFLENMREIHRRIEDARDKLDEEYIFDRHYILSLVDGVLEECSRMAFNASVLAPAAGGRIFQRMDAQKEFAQTSYLKPTAIAANDLPSYSAEQDPEIQFLQAVLQWLQGPPLEKQPVLLDFVRDTTDEVMQLCRKDDLVQKAGSLAKLVALKGCGSLEIVDFSDTAAPEGKAAASIENIQCRPFGLLVLGLIDKGISERDSGEGTGTGGWMLFDRENISLRIRRKRRTIHLEAALYGKAASDFIFLYSQNADDIQTLCPEDAWVEKTALGTMVWICDVPTERLEKHLIQMGSELLCRP